MKIFTNRKKLIDEISNLKKIAFIPTMGALHKGHISLVSKAKKKLTKILVSIYVNPKQFSSVKDFKRYPRNLSKDIQILKKTKIDYLYIPNYEDIYSIRPKTKIYLDNFSKILCGKFRPLHFKGVINIINRFLYIIKPQFIYMGLKDFQQLELIRSHIIKNKIKTPLISCSTVREMNGIALSSRNSKLNKNQLKNAGKIFKFIKNNKRLILYKILNNKKSDVINKLIELGADNVDYIECVNLTKKEICKTTQSRFNIFVAYYMGDVRLIDNL